MHFPLLSPMSTCCLLADSFLNESLIGFLQQYTPQYQWCRLALIKPLVLDITLIDCMTCWQSLEIAEVRINRLGLMFNTEQSYWSDRHFAKTYEWILIFIISIINFAFKFWEAIISCFSRFIISICSIGKFHPFSRFYDDRPMLAVILYVKKSD